MTSATSTVASTPLPSNSTSTSPSPPLTFIERLQRLAIPFVCALIAFLSYSSQIAFHWLDPGPLSQKETIWINILILCIWASYYRAVSTDPGRLPPHLKASGVRDLEREKNGQPNWCRKCDAIKPPRSHHCKICQRCIPKMDHHCPWTSNCTSARTLPPFLRFLLFTVLGMSYFVTVLYTRVMYFYTNSQKLAYLGMPPLWAVVWLFVTCGTTAITLFILTVLLVTSVHSLLLNTTMIETWEIARHQSLVKRAKRNGGFVSTPGGGQLRITQQEFPYDIGIWANICQGMGPSNPLAWFLPWAGGPSNDSVWAFETNGFEEPGETWPPPDPEKIPQPKWQKRRDSWEGKGSGFVLGDEAQRGDDNVVRAFKKRQEADYKKKGLRADVAHSGNGAPGSYDWLELDGTDEESDQGSSDMKSQDDNEEYDGATDSRYGWRNSQGERLVDYGVDEDTELIDDEDDVPLAELLRRRKGTSIKSS